MSATHQQSRKDWQLLDFIQKSRWLWWWWCCWWCWSSQICGHLCSSWWWLHHHALFHFWSTAHGYNIFLNFTRIIIFLYICALDNQTLKLENFLQPICQQNSHIAHFDLGNLSILTTTKNRKCVMCEQIGGLVGGSQNQQHNLIDFTFHKHCSRTFPFSIFLPMVCVHKYAPFPLFAQPSLKPLKAILVRNTLHVAEIEESLLNGKVKVVFKG